MPLYEHVVLARQDLSGAEMESIMDNMKNILENDNGRVVSSEYWGLKSVAYRIKRNRKAHYGFLNIDAPHSAVGEMERQLSLNEDILRFLTLRVSQHDTEPTIMLQKKQRIERKRQDNVTESSTPASKSNQNASNADADNETQEKDA